MLRMILAGTVVIILVGCSGVGLAPDHQDQSNNEHPAAAQQAFHNRIVGTAGCTSTEIALIKNEDPTTGIGGFLKSTIYSNGQVPWDNCLNDSFISEIANGYSVKDISVQFQESIDTNVTCTHKSALPTACGGYYDDWGCASLNTTVNLTVENITLATEMLDAPSFGVSNMASVMAHELAHAHGHPHSNDRDSEYPWAVPERAAACVANGNALPFGQSRTLGMPGEVELGPIGRVAGDTPYEFYGVGAQYVSGILPGVRSGHNSYDYVDYLGIEFTDAGTGAVSLPSPDHVGSLCQCAGSGLCVCPTTISSTQPGWIRCGANEVPIGVIGDLTGPTPDYYFPFTVPPIAATQYVNRMGLICFNYATGEVHDSMESSGLAGLSFRQQCPSYQLMRGIRGRWGGELTQIQLICDYWGKPFSADHAPHAVGKVYGGTSNTKFSIRCSGNGALSALNGRADSTIRRLGATCMPTGGTLPVTPQGPEHPATPYVGAWPDSKGKTAGSLFGLAHCNTDAGELMVGVQIRSSSSALNGISPICANANQWDYYSSGNYYLNVWNGSKSGTAVDQLCPAYQFMVGYDVWSGSSVNGIQIVCADMR